MGFASVTLSAFFVREVKTVNICHLENKNCPDLSQITDRQYVAERRRGFGFASIRVWPYGVSVLYGVVLSLSGNGNAITVGPEPRTGHGPDAPKISLNRVD
jgi:hypothetical protein